MDFSNDSRINALSVLAFISIKSGAETYRVEEIISKTAKNLGFSQVEIMSLPNGVIISLSHINGNDTVKTTIIKRVFQIEEDLDKICKINSISRQLEAKAITPFQAIEMIEQLNTPMNLPVAKSVMATAISCALFAALFKGSLTDVFFSCLSGIIIGIILRFSTLNSITTTFLAALMVSVVTICVGNIGDKSIITAGSIIPLLPGIEMVNAIRDTIMGDIVSGASRAWNALLHSAAIAGGVVVSTWF